MGGASSESNKSSYGGVRTIKADRAQECKAHVVGGKWQGMGMGMRSRGEGERTSEPAMVIHLYGYRLR